MRIQTHACMLHMHACCTTYTQWHTHTQAYTCACMHTYITSKQSFSCTLHDHHSCIPYQILRFKLFNGIPSYCIWFSVLIANLIHTHFWNMMLTQRDALRWVLWCVYVHWPCNDSDTMCTWTLYIHSLLLPQLASNSCWNRAKFINRKHVMREYIVDCYD